MREDVIVGGVILIILGICFIIIGINLTDPMNLTNTMFSSGSYSQMQMQSQVGEALEFLGGIFIILGIVLIPVGIVVSPKGIQKSQYNNQNFYRPIQTNVQIKNRFCMVCGRSIPSDANICPYCGKDFREIDKTEFCPECGTKLGKNSKFCFECGFKLR